jgi:hypothetical protein
VRSIRRKAFGALAGGLAVQQAVTGRYLFARVRPTYPLDDFARLFVRRPARQVLQRQPADVRRYLGHDLEGTAVPASRRRLRRLTSRSSSVRRRSATCSSRVVATSHCAFDIAPMDTDAKQ